MWRELGVLPLPAGEGVLSLSKDLNPSPHPSPSRSRIYPTSANFNAPNSGKPEFGGRGSRPSPSRECAHGAPVQVFAAITSFTAPTQPVWVRSNTMPSGSLYLDRKSTRLN